MQDFFEFLRNALPWIGIGLFAACSSVKMQAKKAGKETSDLFQVLSWSPVLSFLLVAVMEMSDGNASNGTTWLILGLFITMLNFADKQKEGK